MWPSTSSRHNRRFARARARGCSRFAPGPSRAGGFTLIELLTVVSISLLMTALTIPALTSLKNSTDVTSAAYDLSSMLEFARTYAMTNNTYVYVGFQEVDGSVSSSVTPQRPGVGRLMVVAAASKDGTPGFSMGVNGWQNTGAGLTQISKLLRLDAVHAPASLGPVPATGNMGTASGRRDVTAKCPSFSLMSSTGTSATPFTFPLNSTSPQVQLQYVIQYDPQGSARVLAPLSNAGSIDSESVPWCIEICLQQTQGNMTPAVPANPNAGNQVAIQVDGMTGGVRIFRP